MKFEKNGNTIESFNENTFNVFEREGFTKFEREGFTKELDEKKELVKKAKELGIKSPHLMSVETLTARIAELEKSWLQTVR